MNTSPPAFPGKLTVDQTKITDYVLVEPSKSRPFLAIGFSPKDPAIFEAAIKRHGFNAPMKGCRAADYGPEWNYAFDGPLTGPNGGTITRVRSVWCAEPGAAEARFVTAFKVGK